MSIDWSKAPEGANKAGFTGPDNYLQFYRIPGMLGDYDYWSEKKGWFGSDFPTCANHLFERPAKVEWDGQGLPPVGTVCEYYADENTWRRCEIVAHKDGQAVVWVNNAHIWASSGASLRPISTPEQIAAQEREKAIEEMCFAEETLTVKQAKALYDAGYRRQESST
ncbi:TPA: hypothetical protein ACXJW0_002029 [Pseudomonas aeruginosa]